MAPANSLFFRREHRENHKCEACGASLWTALNPSAWGRQKAWAKIGDYGFVYRPLIDEHIRKAKSEALKEKLGDLSMTPGAVSAARGANRAFPLSSYIKRKYKGRIYGLIVDEPGIHQRRDAGQQARRNTRLHRSPVRVVLRLHFLIGPESGKENPLRLSESSDRVPGSALRT